MRRKWIFIVPAALLGIALLIFIGGEAVRLLRNWLLPPLFGWPQITFWHDRTAGVVPDPLRRVRAPRRLSLQFRYPPSHSRSRG